MKRKVRADLRGSMDNVVSGMLKYAGKEIDLDDRSSAYGYYWGEHMLEPLQPESFQITKDRILAAASKCGTALATLEVLFPEAFDKARVDDFAPITLNGKEVIRRSTRTDGDLYTMPGYKLKFLKEGDSGGKTYQLVKE